MSSSNSCGRGRAHPRSRGENRSIGRRLSRSTGSSPLTRGKPHLVNLDHESQGLIPAHAGKTFTFERTSAGETAHPRSRGENDKMHWAARSRLGSSPLTRGKRAPPQLPAASYGLIPAHAGKTASGSSRREKAGAHPRSRGENEAEAQRLPDGAGSSPLTRGKRVLKARRKVRRRLIPAHAGKTERRRRGDHRPRAHPRSRGENRPVDVESRPNAGSSPLTRGKLRHSKAVLLRPGLIPAHAGKTLPDLRFYRADRSDLGKP